MQISDRSLIYRLAYFPNIVYHNERDVGRFIIDFFSDDAGLQYPPADQVSICALFWRVLFSPVSFVLMFVVVPIATIIAGVIIVALATIGAVVFLVILISNGLAWLISKITVSRPTAAPEASVATPLPDLVAAWYQGKKERFCPTIRVVSSTSSVTTSSA